ncbi:MAG: MerR family transcriptional regulator [Candidatus Dormiibacterota bacterium]
MLDEAPGPTPGGPRLKIGDAAALTGVTPGRIRHYQRLGLLSPIRSESGYRYFRAPDLVLLLQIDLLRSLGMGLEEIRTSLPSEGIEGSLASALERHQQTLLRERERLDRLLLSVQRALAAPDASAEAVVAYLASAYSTPRESLGIFGRLTRPLSEEAAGRWQGILGGGWALPVSPILGRMLLPERVSEVLERLARADGNEVLFQRVRRLADAILALSGPGSPGRGTPRQVATDWVGSFISDPLPAEVDLALRETVPRIPELEVLNQGFQLWAESISPSAATVLRLIQQQGRRQGRMVLGVLLVPKPTRPPAQP